MPFWINWSKCPGVGPQNGRRRGMARTVQAFSDLAAGFGRSGANVERDDDGGYTITGHRDGLVVEAVLASGLALRGVARGPLVRIWFTFALGDYQAWTRNLELSIVHDGRQYDLGRVVTLDWSGQGINLW